VVGEANRIGHQSHELRPELTPRSEHHRSHRVGRYQECTAAHHHPAVVKYWLYSCVYVMTATNNAFGDGVAFESRGL
jgi:hypothetical protein